MLNSRENSKHLFFSCPYTSKIWEEVKKVIGLQTPNPDVNKEWTSLFLLGKAATVTAEIRKAYIAATVSYIWRERNFRRFRGAEQPWEVVKGRLLRDMAQYVQSQVAIMQDSSENRRLISELGLAVKFESKVITHCQWAKPSKGRVKLNTDGSVEANRFGYGGAIRDDMGRPVMGYFGSEGMKTVLYQELLAILRGLQCCLQMGLQCIEIASDSQRAVQLIREKEAPPWQCRKLLAEIAEERKKARFTSIKHVYRETNRLADCLSKYADCPMYCSYVNPPITQELENIVQEDLTRVYKRIK
ncbi:hypothetical protein ACHQM5_024947 [Ranunculus cassubicifolius]